VSIFRWNSSTVYSFVGLHGVRHVIFKPPLGPDPAEAIRLLGERVISYFRN